MVQVSRWKVVEDKGLNKQVFSQDWDDFMRIIVTWNSPGEGVIRKERRWQI